jgi:hypothetical protein
MRCEPCEGCIKEFATCVYEQIHPANLGVTENLNDRQ